jgi:hypothetical protein
MYICKFIVYTGEEPQQLGSTDNFAAAPELLGSSGSADDGAAYLASVKAAQQELDEAGGTALSNTHASGHATAAGWPVPSTGCVNQTAMQAMKAATQAALAAAGLPANAGSSSSSGEGVSGADTLSGAVLAAQSAGPEAGVAAGGVAAVELVGDVQQDGQQCPSAAEGEAAAGVRGFDLGLINSWSSAATDPAGSDGDGSSSPPAASRADSSKGSGGSSPAAAVAVAGANASPEDVVLQVESTAACDAVAPGLTATGLYDLD